jgi:uncharacterized sulfatase
MQNFRLAHAWIAGLALLAVGRPALAAERPNVLFIAADDLNNDLGCYGHPLVKTPHLDRLAREGVRFDRAYCQVPFCSPSRTSLMTGRRPAATQVYDLKKHFRSSLPDVTTLPQLFATNGYFAARVGKIYHYGNPGDIGTPGLDDPASWQVALNPAGRDKRVDEPAIIQYTGPKGRFGASLSWLAAEGDDDEHTDGMVAAETIRLLEKHRDRPFFIAAGFYRPHTPYVAPRKYFDLYPPAEQIPLAPTQADDWDDIPKEARNNNFDRQLDDTQRRLLRRAYWASISFLDAQVGRLLDALDRLDLRRRTIVVFWSDHGYLLGEHQLWMKQSCFEEAARVPLLISAPGFGSAGQASPRVVELLDLYPTLADLAGLRPISPLDGVSLRPLLEKPSAPWDRPAYTEIRRAHGLGRSIRTERFRYTEWDQARLGAELYDHTADPREWTNLTGKPEWEHAVEELKRRLHDGGR